MSHYVYHNTKLIQSKCKFEYQIFGISEQSASKIAARDRDGALRSICYLFLRPIKEKLNRSFTLNAKIFSSSTTKQEGKTILEWEIMPNFFGQSDTKLLGKWENVLGKWHKLLGKWLKLLGKWSNFVGETKQICLGTDTKCVGEMLMLTSWSSKFTPLYWSTLPGPNLPVISSQRGVRGSRVYQLKWKVKNWVHERLPRLAAGMSASSF